MQTALMLPEAGWPFLIWGDGRLTMHYLLHVSPSGTQESSSKAFVWH